MKRVHCLCVVAGSLSTGSSLLFLLFVSNGDWVQQQDQDAGQYRQTAEQVRRMPSSRHVSQQPCISHIHTRRRHALVYHYYNIVQSRPTIWPFPRGSQSADWADDNHLRLNATKSREIIFQARGMCKKTMQLPPPCMPGYPASSTNYSTWCCYQRPHDSNWPRYSTAGFL